ncbi:mechanosensitive ion channel domain-containing protein [Ruegeria lacuscaerulensis]|uniref:mechanosensitive ion channel domain-containing protein n=1 Tax=Ruegeria lacuscaerulensis TaxID=55218 RepID=UPI0014804E63|nr:mechanosensitive ion channel domain-containing protein [Ruegeria lacuscaerulensis]
MEQLTTLVQSYPGPTLVVLVIIALIASPFLKTLIGSIAMRFAIRVGSIQVDLIVDALRPFHFVYAFPVGVAFFLANLGEPYAYEIRLISGLLLIAIAIETIIKILAGIGGIIRHNAGDKGASSTGYVDLAKVVVFLLGVAFAISITVETDVVTLLSGLGALTAVLMFIFRDTLMAIQASLRIASWDLLREGDKVKVPGFKADGTVKRIGLYDITVENGDYSTTLIPTHKFFDSANMNYRHMTDTMRARLVLFTFVVKADSVHFCSVEELEKLRDIPLLSDDISTLLADLDNPSIHTPWTDFSKSGITNFELFQVYMKRFIQTQKNVHQRRHPIGIKALPPTVDGYPVEVVAFSKKTSAGDIATIQSELLTHFLAVSEYFGIRLI